MGRSWEKFGHYIIAMIVVAVYVFVDIKIKPDFISFTSIKDLLSASISIDSIAIGFLATLKSILFSLVDNALFKRFKTSGRVKSVVSRTLNTIRLFFLAALISTIGLLIDVNNCPSMSKIFLCIWFFMHVSATLSYYKIIKFYSNLLMWAHDE